MSLPRKLKNMNLFNEGESYLGQIKTVVLPKLTRKMEDYRGGGLNAPLKIDMGMGDDGLVLESTFGGLLVGHRLNCLSACRLERSVSAHDFYRLWGGNWPLLCESD